MCALINSVTPISGTCASWMIISFCCLCLIELVFFFFFQFWFTASIMQDCNNWQYSPSYYIFHVDEVIKVLMPMCPDDHGENSFSSYHSIVSNYVYDMWNITSGIICCVHLFLAWLVHLSNTCLSLSTKYCILEKNMHRLSVVGVIKKTIVKFAV